MSVGVLIITHEGIATAILDTAVNILGKCPLSVEVLPAARDCDTEALSNRVREKVDSLDEATAFSCCWTFTAAHRATSPAAW